MIKIGDSIPNTTIAMMQNQAPTAIETDALFKNCRTALFALPGAFTPTCSQGHLPGFVKLADKIKEKNIDKIACLSVNDAFVMQAWGNQHNVGDKILMLADGSAHLTTALGLQLDLADKSFGIRSQRYAMVINNGTVEKLWVEDNGKFEVSSAEYLLENI